MDQCIEIGMITGNTGGGQTTATFSNVTVVGSGPQLVSDESGFATAQTTRNNAARLFPNPVSSQLSIDLPAELPMEATLTLRNQLGQALEVRQLEAGLFRADWDVSQLSGGVYYMEVRYKGQQPQVLRFVKTN